MPFIKNRDHKTLIFLTILSIMLTACTTGLTVGIITPTVTAAPAPVLSGLSPDAIDTLNSLEKLHDYPFYVMHFIGDYDYPQTGLQPTFESGFSCSLYAALDKTGDMFYGRNFDWEFSPALLLFTDPTDGYASVSMVDLTFIGINPATSRMLIDYPNEKRAALLTAPSMPFDGMNEYGLAIGMAAVPDEYLNDASFDPSKPTIGSIGIIRQVLDHARNVDEALELFNEYNIDFSGGPPIHYLIADSSGKAVLVEFYKGQVVQMPNEAPWHMATNHLRCIAEGDGGCARYRTLSERLSAVGGQLNPQSAIQLLSEVDQDMTQWSTVYNMTTGDIEVAISRFYDTIYSFHIDMLNH